MIYEEALQKGLIEDPIAFLLSNKSELNGTAMSDQEYDYLKDTLVPQYIMSFGLPGRVLELSHTGNGYCFDLKCVCPHCSEELSYQDVALETGVVNRISCRFCNQLFRIPVRFRNRSSAQVQQLHEKLQNLLPSQSNELSTESVSEIFSVCQEIISIDPGYDRAWTILLELLDKTGKTDSAAEIQKSAIISNPYNPDLFDQMDARLAKKGLEEERIKYSRQAALLRKIGVTAPLDIEIQFN